MRPTALIVLLALAGSIVPVSAQRAWKEGRWATAPAEGLVAIEAAADVMTARPADGDTPGRWAGTPGDGVRYVLDGATLYLLDREDHEHALHVVETTPKYSTEYGALGGGHYIKAVAPGGVSLTLEDDSRWDIDPRQRFAVAAWHPDDLISVRRSTDDPAFAFEIDNTSQDDGTLANRLVP
jgi:hypothetical protein